MEVDQGYLWSPKAGQYGARIQYYENMTRALPGDLVLSFIDRRIAHAGIVQQKARTAEKPSAYGSETWNKEGWRVPVSWSRLPEVVEPRLHIAAIRPLLPEKYSPIRADGNGNQVYLAEIPRRIFEIIINSGGSDIAEWERLSQRVATSRPNRPQHVVRRRQRQAATPAASERAQTVKVRVGQGLFRIRTSDFEQGCRLTGITNPRLLMASHIKPWRDCTTEERLDGANGLLLTPHVDRLFDRGLISFEDTGEVKVSPRLTAEDLERLGLTKAAGQNSGAFDVPQQAYLAHHRKHIYKSE